MGEIGRGIEDIAGGEFMNRPLSCLRAIVAVCAALLGANAALAHQPGGGQVITPSVMCFPLDRWAIEVDVSDAAAPVQRLSATHRRLLAAALERRKQKGDASSTRLWVAPGMYRGIDSPYLLIMDRLPCPGGCIAEIVTLDNDDQVEFTDVLYTDSYGTDTFTFHKKTYQSDGKYEIYDDNILTFMAPSRDALIYVVHTLRVPKGLRKIEPRDARVEILATTTRIVPADTTKSYSAWNTLYNCLTDTYSNRCPATHEMTERGMCKRK